MNNRFNSIIERVAAALLLLPLFFSCRNWDPVVSDPTFESSAVSVSVPADYEDGSYVADTIVVSSNRSWSAHLIPECEWVRLDSEGDLNVSGSRRNVNLALDFDNNLTEQDRSTKLVLTTAEKTIEVSVKQAAIVYRLKATSETKYKNVDHLGAFFLLTFNCNTDWTARIKEGSDAPATISADSGNGNGIIGVTFDENEEYVGKKFVVVVSAKGCQDIEFCFEQMSSRPYVLIDETQTDTSTVQSIGAYRNIVFRSNVSWIAETGGDIVFTDVPESGEAGKNSFKFYMDGNTDMDLRKKGYVLLTPIGGDPVKVEYVMEKGSIVTLRFRLYPDAYSTDNQYRNWPFQEELINNTQDVTFHTKTGNYPFFFHYEGTTGNLNYNQCGIIMGNTVNGGYIDLAGMEGRKLVKVEVFIGNESQTIYASVVNPADNTPLSGGDRVLLGVNTVYQHKRASTSVTQEVLDDPQCYHCWELSGTEAGKSYRLLYTKQRMMLRWLTLTYE